MSFGEELRRERELREISLREVSESTKISLRHLEALERNEFQGLPGGVFNRGFVRAYAKFIGVDPDAMVNAYLLEEQGQSGQAPHERHLLRRVRGRSKESSGEQAKGRPGRLRWVVAAVILIALAIGLYFVLRLATGGTVLGGERSVRDGSRSRVASSTSGAQSG